MPVTYAGLDDDAAPRRTDPRDHDHVAPGTVEIRMSAPRSEIPKPARKVLLAIIAASILLSLRFVMLGAWPVLIFSLLDIGALLTALYLFGRGRPQQERLQIAVDRIALIRADETGRTRRIEFPPFWTRLETISRSEADCQLFLVFRHRREPIASCLSASERLSIAPRIAAALATARP